MLFVLGVQYDSSCQARTKFRDLGLHATMCRWILDFLSSRRQVIRLATHSSNVIIKFADGTTVMGLIADEYETAYRDEVRSLAQWCHENN
ncbi:hypothetical protein SKAU_G00195640 [Synaphobranchus kaupii]|uniref:Uncharacterized protein n=1 Tax=Synaphobranchus kaupii TaxID=118154 RepID=A0A9Q1IXU7_SYNKA|nr:hypothetical protein SKAU_G00195640 [Synaphobranchus kaupii]